MIELSSGSGLVASIRNAGPEIALEVAFDDIQRSSGHGRFPRIVRVRTDRSPPGIGTLADVAQQHAARAREAEARRDGAERGPQSAGPEAEVGR
jgi:hypothetical protein